MKKNILVIISFTLIICFSVTAFASGKTPVVNKRQQEQSERIKQGIRSGELNKRETAVAVSNQVKIARMEKRAKADGIVTTRESIKLNRELNNASDHIYRAKHN